MKNLSGRIPCIVLFFLLFIAAKGYALTYEFKGTISLFPGNDYDDFFQEYGIKNQDQYIGQISYEYDPSLTIVGGTGFNTFMIYSDAPVTTTLNINGLHIHSNVDSFGSRMRVRNLVGGDSIRVNFFDPSPGNLFFDEYFYLFEGPNTSIDDARVPSVSEFFSFNLGSLGFNLFSADMSHSFASIRGSVDSYVPAPVPEPASILLIGLGLIGLIGIKKKIRKT